MRQYIRCFSKKLLELRKISTDFSRNRVSEQCENISNIHRTVTYL